MSFLERLLALFSKEPQLTGLVENPEQDNDPRNLHYEDMAPFGAGSVPEAGDIEKGDWTLAQGAAASCTCHSTVYAINQVMGYQLSPLYCWKRIKTDPKYPSSQLAYGGYMVDSLKAMKNEGICEYKLAPSASYPGVDDYKKLIITPAMEVSANRHKGGNYVYVTTSVKDNLDRFDDVVRYLYEQGKPVKVGVDWRGSFNKARTTGVVPAVAPSGSSGGHDMLAVAWKRINGHEYLGFRNSFGPTWGDKGRIWLPKGFFRISTALAYLPPVEAEEMDIKKPEPITSPRNANRERANAEELRAVIENKFPLNVTSSAREMNKKALAQKEREWLVLWMAVTYRGWTFTDVVNYLYAHSRGKTENLAYSINFNTNKQ